MLSSVFGEEIKAEAGIIKDIIDNPSMIGDIVDNVIEEVLNETNLTDAKPEEKETIIDSTAEESEGHDTKVQETPAPINQAIVPATDLTEEQRNSINALMEKYFINPDFYDWYDQYGMPADYKAKVKEATINQLMIAMKYHNCPDNKKFILYYQNFTDPNRINVHDVTCYYSVDENYNVDNTFNIEVYDLIKKPDAHYYVSQQNAMPMSEAPMSGLYNDTFYTDLYTPAKTLDHSTESATCEKKVEQSDNSLKKEVTEESAATETKEEQQSEDSLKKEVTKESSTPE
jgi:hypothetical protein